MVAAGSTTWMLSPTFIARQTLVASSTTAESLRGLLRPITFATGRAWLSGVVGAGDGADSSAFLASRTTMGTANAVSMPRKGATAG